MQLINIAMDKYIHSSKIALEFRIEYLILKQKISFMTFKIEHWIL